MRRLVTGTLIPVLLSIPLLGQPAATPIAAPAFEAADVHVSPERLHPAMRGNFHAGRVSLRDATLADLIAAAYGVEPADVLGGPPWLDFDRFDINAKGPADAKDEESQAMLRTLLADRFKLVAHTGKRPLPAFVLTVGKASKLKPAAAPAAEPGENSFLGCQYQQRAPNSAPPAPGTPPPPIKFSCRNTTMENFVEFLHDVASPYLGRPVFDQTGLKGGWDFDLEWNYQKSNDGSGTSIFDAVDKQLGLKLESKPWPTSVVVVDSVDQKPTPDIADLDKILPPPPAASFDVAVIRPAAPDERRFNMQIQGHRVNVRYATLLTLIYSSFNIAPGKIENKPKWLDDVHWDIMGTASTGDASSPIPGAGRDLDVEDVNEMLRSLLADRFKLVTHTGSQPSTVFALVADNPRMKKADDANHPTCFEGPLPGGKDPRIDNPLLNRLISCQNMTMAQFAIELHSLASGYAPAPVIDSTGLNGAYDFSLSFSKANALRAPTAAPTAAGTDAATIAADPGGGISLFDALEKQLGLKLVKKDSVPTPTLVIDHVEDHPTDN